MTGITEEGWPKNRQNVVHRSACALHSRTMGYLGRDAGVSSNRTYRALLLYPWVSFGLGVSVESSPTWPTSPSVITG
jgi:hypothetical protein